MINSYSCSFWLDIIILFYSISVRLMLSVYITTDPVQLDPYLEILIKIGVT